MDRAQETTIFVDSEATHLFMSGTAALASRAPLEAAYHHVTRSPCIPPSSHRLETHLNGSLLIVLHHDGGVLDWFLMARRLRNN